MRQRLAFGSGHSLDLRLSRRLDRSARTALALELSCVGATIEHAPPTDEPPDAAVLSCGLSDDPTACEVFAALHPGEGEWCERDGRIRHYCRDGFIEYQADHPWTEVRFAPERLPSLAGALGVALIRCLSITGTLVLHAAVLHYNGLGLLLLGPSGAGKSTLCAASLRAGGRIVSDDVVLVAQKPSSAQGAGRVSAYPFRRDMYLRAATRDLLPPQLVANLKPERRLSGWKLRLGRDLTPAGFSAMEPLDCIAVLGQGARPEHSRASALRSGDTFGHVLSGRLYQLTPIVRRPLMAAALRLATSLPAVTLDVGTNLLHSPEPELDRICAAVLGAIHRDRSHISTSATSAGVSKRVDGNLRERYRRR